MCVGISAASEEVEIGMDLGKAELCERACATHDIPADGTTQHHELNVLFIAENVGDEKRVCNNREGSAEDCFGNAEGGRTGIENNDRIIWDDGCSRFPDGFFFALVLRQGVGDDTRCDLGDHCPTVRTGDGAFFFQGREVGADGDLGDGESVRKVFDGEVFFLFQDTQDFILSLGESHWPTSFQWPVAPGAYLVARLGRLQHVPGACSRAQKERQDKMNKIETYENESKFCYCKSKSAVL